jgi:hypothetical protein
VAQRKGEAFYHYSEDYSWPLNLPFAGAQPVWVDVRALEHGEPELTGSHVVGVRCRDGDGNVELLPDLHHVLALVRGCTVDEDQRVRTPAPVLDVELPHEVSDEHDEGVGVRVGLAEGHVALAEVIEGQKQGDARRPVLLGHRVRHAR